jgi:hypothetical protein
LFHTAAEGIFRRQFGSATNCRVVGTQATNYVDGVVKSSPSQCSKDSSMGDISEGVSEVEPGDAALL